MDISCVMTIHDEAYLSGVSLNSMLQSISNVKSSGLEVELIVVMDDPSAATEKFISNIGINGLDVYKVGYKDQGLTRNYAVSKCKGEFIAFNDADDLWSENWLIRSYDIAKSNDQYIVHPEYNYFFENSGNILVHVDQEDPDFDISMLRVFNCWDALCFAKKSVYESVPYSVRDVEGGYAYEDWLWNCETITKGYIHKIAKNTIHFKRRRKNSQTIKASARKVLIRQNPILSF